MKLIIDTSTRKTLLALEESGKFTTRIFEPRFTQKLIFCELAELTDAGRKNIDRVIVGLGPGSFTGVKIGVMAAKALAWSKRIPLVGIGSLDSVAESTPATVGENKSLLVAVPSTKGEIYLKIYQSENNRWRGCSGILDISLKSPDLFKIIPEKSLIISGEAATQLADAISGARDYEIMPEVNRFPSAEAMAVLASEKEKSSGFDDPISLAPDYIRLSQPERKQNSEKQ